MYSKDISNTKINIYSIGQNIGEGSFAQVYEALDTNKNIFAIKAISMKIYQNIKYKKYVQQQIGILKQCRSQNIVKYIDTIRTKDHILIVLQYCQTTLKKYRQSKPNKRFTQSQAVTFLKQLLDGLTVLHSNSIIHRDLKQQNLLIKKGVLKIADFGVAKKLQSNQSLTSTYVGSLAYMSPQIIAEQQYGLEADIFSLGIIFYEMLYSKSPFQGKNERQRIRNIKNQKIRFQGNNISPKAKEFIQKCLIYDKDKRFTLKDALYHPLIQDNVQVQRTIFFKAKNPQQYFKKQNRLSLIEQLQLQQINQIQRKQKQKQLYQHKKKYIQFQAISRTYMKKRNQIFFFLKNVCRNIIDPSNTSRHANFMFILGKHTLFEMMKFESQLLKKENIFNLKQYLKQFVQSPEYKLLLSKIKDDIEIIKLQLQEYAFLVKINNVNSIDQDVKKQLNIEKKQNKDWTNFLKNKIKCYEYFLIDCPQRNNQRHTYNINKSIQALNYSYNNYQKIDDEQFERQFQSQHSQQLNNNILQRYYESFNK